MAPTGIKKKKLLENIMKIHQGIRTFLLFTNFLVHQTDITLML
jgi:hypothetical protein